MDRMSFLNTDFFQKNKKSTCQTNGSLIYYQTCSRDKRSGVLAGVAQLAEQLICNQQVAGSSPITGLKRQLRFGVVFFVCQYKL